MLAGYGYDRNQFQDDSQAVAALAQQARQAQAYQQQLAQAQQLAQYGQLYVQHADQFAAYMRQQQEAEQAKRASQNQWWKAPEYDPAWSSRIYQDASGNLVAAPGSPPDTVQKYLAWRDHQTKFLTQFSQDPIQAIRPGIEQLVEEKAKALLQQHMGQFQAQTAAQRLVEQNNAWMYEQDPSGQRTLTPWGRLYAGYVQQADQMGLQGVDAQHQYAIGLVERDYLRYKAQQPATGQAQTPPVDPAAQTKNDFLQRAAGQALQQPAPPPGNTQGTQPAVKGPRALQQQLLANLVADGYQPGQSLVA